MKNVLEVPADIDGRPESIVITEDDLKTITDEELAKLEISREELHRCFAEGVKQMQEKGFTDSDRVRPSANQRLDGKWEVHIVRYSALSDPPMEDSDGTKQ